MRSYLSYPQVRASTISMLSARATATTLALLTFDLDDTLFCCGDVVKRANAALSRGLATHAAVGFDHSGIQDRMRVVRPALAERGPFSYSDLRREAIASILERSSYDDDVEELFQLWLVERQHAANELLFDGAVEALQCISSTYPDIIIGGITNGRGDTDTMPALAPYFNLPCVSGDLPPVFPDRKPSVKIYEHALCRAAAMISSSSDEEVAVCMDRVRSGWVHVGDSLVNDVKASKQAGALTVWLDAPPPSESAFSTASPELAAARQAAAQEALDAGFIDERIERLSELPDAIQRLCSLRGGGAAVTSAATSAAAARDGDVDDLFGRAGTAGRHAIRSAALSFALVSSACSSVHLAAVRDSAVTRRAAMGAAVRSGRRWGCISAGFNGARTFGLQYGLPELWATAAGAMVGGAGGAVSIRAMPRRACAYLLMALMLETAAPVAIRGAQSLGSFLEAELITSRREQFARGSRTAGTRGHANGARGTCQGSRNPLERLDALVEQLNSELGHGTR